MNLNDKFGTDKKAESEGRWVSIGENGRLLLARIGNPKFDQLQRELLEPYKTEIRAGTFSVEKRNELFRQAVSRTILLGWEGIKYNGEELPYSPEKAFEILMALPDFAELVVRLANDLETFRAGAVEESKKN